MPRWLVHSKTGCLLSWFGLLCVLSILEVLQAPSPSHASLHRGEVGRCLQPNGFSPANDLGSAGVSAEWRVVPGSVSIEWRLRRVEFFADSQCLGDSIVTIPGVGPQRSSYRAPARGGDGSQAGALPNGQAFAVPGPDVGRANEAFRDNEEWYGSGVPCTSQGNTHDCAVGFRFESTHTCEGDTGLVSGAYAKVQCAKVEQSSEDGYFSRSLALQWRDEHGNWRTKFRRSQCEGGISQVPYDAEAWAGVGVSNSTPPDPPAIHPQNSQSMKLVCQSGCSTGTIAYLGTSCDTNTYNGVHVASTSAGIDTAAAAFSGSAPLYTLTVNAPLLTAGKYYSFCVDVDGETNSLPFETVEGLAVYISGVLGSSPDYVWQYAWQYATVDVSEGLLLDCTAGACSTSSEGYLATACDSALNGGPSAVEAHKHTATSQFQSRPGSKFALIVNASKLLSGMHYKLCTDLDGASGPFKVGDSLRVAYVTGTTLVDTTASIFASLNQLVLISCSESCSASSRGYLATSCDSSVNDGSRAAVDYVTSTSFAFVSHSSHWKVTVDATALSLGLQYRLCVDLDGSSTVMAFGDTGQDVYISGIASIAPTSSTYGSPSFVFTVTCDPRAPCGADSNAYLSTSCDTSGTGANIKTNSSQFIGSAPDFTVTLDVTSLSAGTYYELCTDLDGAATTLPNGKSLVRVYVTGLTSVIPSSYAIQAVASQKITFECLAGCSTDSVGYLATACDSSIAGTHTGVSGDSTSSASLVGSSTLFTLTLDTTSLNSGRNYSICFDTDGVATYLTFADTLLSVYHMGISPQPEVVLNVAASQTFSLVCQGCHMGTQGYLRHISRATSCDSDFEGNETFFNGTDSVTTGSSFLSLTNSGTSTWSLTVEADNLLYGAHYGICLNPATSGLGFMDSHLLAYVTGITATSFTSIASQASQTITLTCAAGCSTSTAVYLSTACDSSDSDGVHVEQSGQSTNSVTLTGIAPTYTVTLDARPLGGGTHRICSDLDGTATTLAFGSSGVEISILYVSTTTTTTTSYPVIANPSFETGAPASGFQYGAITSWTRSGATVYIKSGTSAWGSVNAPDGSAFVGLQYQTGTAYISQAVDGHNQGQAYKLSFFATSRPSKPVATLVVSLDGATVLTVSPGDFTVGTFKQYSVEYNATATSVTIKFTNGSPPSDGDTTPFLDLIDISDP